VRIVAIAGLTVLSTMALRKFVPGAELNSFAAALGEQAAWAVAVAVLCAALFVVAGPLLARVSDWHRAALIEDAGDDATDEQERHRRRPLTKPSLQSLALIGCCLTLLAEFAALCLPSEAAVQALPGSTVGLILIRMCTSLGVRPEPPAPRTSPDDVGESLQRAISRIDARIMWSEGTRSDWDLRVRPVLARQFETATKAGQRRMTDPAAFRATGLMLFGESLWPWVDPDNVLRTRTPERGPGRKVLEDIIDCLEQV
jgi:hypothetical protein